MLNRRSFITRTLALLGICTGGKALSYVGGKEWTAESGNVEIMDLSWDESAIEYVKINYGAKDFPMTPEGKELFYNKLKEVVRKKAQGYYVR